MNMTYVPQGSKVKWTELSTNFANTINIVSRMNMSAMAVFPDLPGLDFTEVAEHAEGALRRMEEHTVEEIIRSPWKHIFIFICCCDRE